MKYLILIVFVLAAQNVLGSPDSDVHFPDDYFDYIYDTIPESKADLMKHEPKEIPWDVVSRYLVQTQNFVACDIQRWNLYNYISLGSFYYNDVRFLIYSRENRNEDSYEIFLAPWIDQSGYPLTLRIFGSHYENGYSYETFFRSDDCSIGVFTVSTKDEIPSLKSKTYLLNSSLTIYEECIEIGFEPQIIISHHYK